MDGAIGVAELSTRCEELARVPVLLVCSDFDGTLAPIVAEPGSATPIEGAVNALHALAAMPYTHVAVISGRALNDLAAVSGLSQGVMLVGSHGSEFGPRSIDGLDPSLIELRETLLAELNAIAASAEGCLVEPKPAGAAFHFRNASNDAAARALASLTAGPVADSRLYVKQGKEVCEFSLVPADKGTALAALRNRVGASAVIFAGDDVTDEDVFAVLGEQDVGVKVGTGDTRAVYRVRGCAEAAVLFQRLAALRMEWLRGFDTVAIDHHSILSDQRTVALVTPDARVVWFSVPRVDSPPIFAELLGGPRAGHFAIEPLEPGGPPAQAYLDGTFVLQTTWPRVAVTDYLDCSNGRPYQRAGRTDLVRVVHGDGRVRITFAPRLDYGREPTRLRAIPGGLRVEGALDPIVLRAPGIDWTIEDQGSHQRALAELDLNGSEFVMELRNGLLAAGDLVVPELRRRQQTAKFWTVWSEHLRVPSLHGALIRRSALVLKALTYGPTGAIFAAGTTSLPEHLGGARNWDYRYCWLRDAAIAATALAKLGSTGAGTRLLDWLLGVLDRTDSLEWVRPLYTVTGGHVSPDSEIRELSGYFGSRPVRVGNSAAHQLQLDVFGPMMELLTTLAELGVAISTEHWRLTRSIVTLVADRWREADHGIWEIRGPRRHHVHSKTMCWTAVDRALRMAAVFAEQQPEEWLALRAAIAEDVLAHGWNESAGLFSSAYDDSEPDAASLQVGLSGLVAADDARFVRTVESIERSLRCGPTVYRYHYRDGLPGREGGFHLCTSWLIEALVATGRKDHALELLDGFATLFGPTGLASEEYCPVTRLALGNHPQAYTHAGFINAAIAVANTS